MNWPAPGYGEPLRDARSASRAVPLPSRTILVRPARPASARGSPPANARPDVKDYLLPVDRRRRSVRKDEFADPQLSTAVWVWSPFVRMRDRINDGTENSESRRGQGPPYSWSAKSASCGRLISN